MRRCKVVEEFKGHKVGEVLIYPGAVYDKLAAEGKVESWDERFDSCVETATVEKRGREGKPMRTAVKAKP